MAVAAGRHPVERNLFLSQHPRDDAPRLYVGGRVATVLRFEKPCDAARTRMLGWEGRFEPLVVGGRTVVLYPLQDLTPEDRFLLLVTLADGTELPFTVTAHRQLHDAREVDQQVNVFADREGYDAVLASLYASLQRERELTAQVERYQREDSVDHALAALLAKGAVKQTPFRYIRGQLFKGEGTDIAADTFMSRDKAALVFQVKNLHPDAPWRLLEARLKTATTWEARPFALRMEGGAIAPGASGSLVVVVDASAFASKNGTERLVLELFRADGMQQAVVLLDPPSGR
jgi:uncharacterized protein (TIGR02268 family)